MFCGIPVSYTHTNEEVAKHWIDQLVKSMSDDDYPIEVQSKGRTLKRCKQKIVACHSSQVSNAPTEAMNNLITRTKRIAFGFVNFRNFRIRVLLYAGRVNWDLLESARPF
ncbi:transposase [Ferrimicrobium acidiphilum]|uniref:transposase n=1 Tax=Ferrimicrobium acidiphilum TaxID=121039 RepID=UPI0023F4486B|nr:transposase [Ferrimicrobium acidiphilum]